MSVSRGEPSERPRKQYNAPRRRTKAEANRRSVLKAARELFVTSGFVQTTVDAIALAAGVSSQTVYAVFGSKASLLLALLDDLERTVDAGGYAASIDAAIDAGQQLRLIVEFHCELFERGLDLIELARRSSADPSVGPFVDEGHRRRRAACERWVARWEREGLLRPDVDAETAADLLWVQCGPDLYAAFVLGCGWERQRVETWLLERLRFSLLAGPAKKADRAPAHRRTQSPRR
jgi:TetR/AcrR family transcriptional regulator, regulator of cefoperazone and chloramphenicol sensitivity